MANDDLTAVINRFVAAESWNKAQQIVEAHPELLSDAADERFGLVLVKYADNPDAVQILTVHRALLRRCREAGIARAFTEQILPPEVLAEAERMGLTPEEFLVQMSAVQQQMPPALRELLAELAGAGVEILNPEDLERALAARPGLRAKLEAAVRIMEDAAAPAADLPSLLDRFVRLDTWGDALRFLDEHPVLLSDAADAMLGMLGVLANAVQDANAVERFILMQGVLRRCREVGIARALIEKMLSPEALAEAERLGMTPEELLRPLRTAQQVLPTLQEVLAELVAEGVDPRSPKDLERALTARPDLYVTLEAAMTDGGDPMPPEFAADLRAAQDGEQHYRRTGDLAALDAAAVAWTRILNAPGFDTTSARFRLAVLNDAATVFIRRYHARGQVSDLNRALAGLEQAVKLAPPESPDRATLFGNLGSGLRDRYARTGRLEDLDAAIGANEQAVKLTPPDSPDHPSRLSNLGNGLRDRYVRSGRLEDLDTAIGMCERAVKEVPPDSPDLSSFLNNLGNGLRDRYVRTGRLEDLEAAIGAYEQAVKLTPPDSPDRPRKLNNLGACLRDRYARTGRLEDLYAAIEVCEQALRSMSPESPDRRGSLSNLGNGLRDRYVRTERLEDLEAAIDAYEQAVKLTPIDSPDRPSLLSNLGVGLRNRYVRTGRLEDLEAAIGVYEQAVKLTPLDSLDRPGNLNNLGAGLSDLYVRTGRLEDLDAAIGAYAQAVKLTPLGSPDRPSRLNNLGTGLRDRYARTGRLEDLNAAIRAYRAACELGAAAAPEEVVRAARNWGRWALAQQSWDEADEAYGHGLAAGRALWRRQLRRADKESWLTDMQEMAPAAAYAQARLDDPAHAVTTLEVGRAQLLAEGLEQNRRDLERLPALGHGEFHARYLAVLAERRRLEQPDAVVADRLAAIAAADQEFDAVIAAIRGVAGYADFFADPTFARIQAAAPEVPLVYIAVSAAGGLALIVHPDGIETVWLNGLTDAALRTTVLGAGAELPPPDSYLGAYDRWLNGRAQNAANRKAWHKTIDDMTFWLWETVMAPVVERLVQASVSEAVLIPGGLLGLLPLHAAWTPDASMPTGRRYALDSVTFRYAPSATALAASQERAQRLVVDSILAVDNPDGSLAFSGQEVAAALSHFAPEHRLHLAGPSATLDAVQSGVASVPVLHFSTHGWAGWSQPLEGGLLLADNGRLTLAALLDMKLPDTRLAVLSACETGVPGTKVPDEVIGLPAGLLQAGVAGVAASLWAVNDLSTARLMERFYQAWLDEGLTPAAALCRAQRWLRDVTRQELDDYAGVASRHLRPTTAYEEHTTPYADDAPDDRPYSHPYYWAAFTFSGA